MSSPPRRGKSDRKEFFDPRPPRDKVPESKKSSKTRSAAEVEAQAPPPAAPMHVRSPSKAKGRSHGSSLPAEIPLAAPSPARVLLQDVHQEAPALPEVRPPGPAPHHTEQLRTCDFASGGTDQANVKAEQKRQRPSRARAEREAAFSRDGPHPALEVEAYFDYVSPPSRAAAHRSKDLAARRAAARDEAYPDQADFVPAVPRIAKATNPFFDNIDKKPRVKKARREAVIQEGGAALQAPEV